MTHLISREELRQAIGTGSVTVIDALPASYYAQQHLPGALNLTSDEVTNRAGDLLPDTAAPIVTYCTNPACGNSEAVAAQLTALGYTNVRRYREGIEDWAGAGLPTETGAPVAT